MDLMDGVDKKTELSLRRKWLRRENAKWPVELTQVPEKGWRPVEWDSQKRVAVWRSRDYLVQVVDEGGGYFRISINRSEIDGDGKWRDGLTWDELQEIKNAVGFASMDAVEIYPAAEDVVNVANMRHLWVLPCPFALAWRRGKKADGETRGLEDAERGA